MLIAFTVSSEFVLTPYHIFHSHLKGEWSITVNTEEVFDCRQMTGCLDMTDLQHIATVLPRYSAVKKKFVSYQNNGNTHKLCYP